MLAVASRNEKWSRMRHPRDSYSIPLFVFGSYLVSWPIWFSATHFRGGLHIEIHGLTADVPHQAVVVLLGNIGPGLSATVIVFLTGGWQPVCQLWGGLKNWRINPAWLVFVFLLIPALDSLALLGYWLFGGTIVGIGSPIRLLLLIVFNLPFAPLWEEIGWRGFLLPKLEGRHNGLRASLILSCVWGPWHLPLYWNSPFEFILWFLAMIIPLAVLFTWIYNCSHGSLVPVVMLHVMVNALFLFLVDPTIRSYGIRPFQFVVGFIFCAAVIVILSVGPDLSRDSLLGPPPSCDRLPG
jgi:membrane protease YdiL (CAAX protease family)